jgi:hypothetical protein
VGPHEEEGSLVDELGRRRGRRRREVEEEDSEKQETGENQKEVEERMREFREEFEAAEAVNDKMREFREEMERAEVDERVREFREEFEREESEREASKKEAGDGISGEMREVSEDLDEQFRSDIREHLDQEVDEHKEESPERTEEEPENSDAEDSEQDDSRVDENTGGGQVTITVEVESAEESPEGTEDESEDESGRAEAEERAREEISEESRERPAQDVKEGTEERESSKESRDELEEPDVEDTEENERPESREEQPETQEEEHSPEQADSNRPSKELEEGESGETDDTSDVGPPESTPQEQSEDTPEETLDDEEKEEANEAEKDDAESSAEQEVPRERQSRIFPDGDPVRPTIFPDGGPVRASMFPETQEERLRRILGEEFEKLSEEEKERIRKQAKESLKDDQDLEKYLEAHKREIDDTDLDEKVRDAEEYLRVKAALENAEDDEDLDELCNELDIDREKLERLKDDANAPELVKELWNLETERRWAEILLGRFQGLREDTREASLESVEHLPWDRNCIIVTERQYEEALARHQHLRFRIDFNDRDWDVRVFFALKEALEEGEVNRREFAEAHNIAVQKIRRWAREEKIPGFLSELHRLEVRRLYVEANGGPPEVRIESTGDVRKLAARHGREEKIDYEMCEKYFGVRAEPETLLKDLALKYEVSDTTISQWLRETEPRDISDLRRREEERILEEWYQRSRLKLPLEEKLENTERCIRRISEQEVLEFEPNPDRMSLLHMYREQFFYFKDINSFASLLADTKKALTGDRGGELRSTAERLEHLMDEVFGPHKVPRINIAKMRIRGDHLEFLLEVSGRSIRDLEGDISRITTENGMGGISNPRFPPREDLLVIWARVIATIVCDGSLKKSAAVAYHEPEITRIEIFERTVQRLGKVSLNPKWRKDHNCYIAHLPTVIGRVLQELGLPTGDKTIHNPEIDISLFKESWEALCAIIEDSIPQDGTVLPRAISWTFSNALNAGNKSEAYDFEPILDKEEVAFIKEIGKSRKNCWSVAWGKLDELAESGYGHSQESSIRIIRKAEENPNRLALNMKAIGTMLGVRIAVSPGTIRLMKKTDRVSVSWYARTRFVSDMVKLGLIAPPNDVRKREILKEYLRPRQDLVRKIEAKLKKRGVKIQLGGVIDE